MLTLCLLCSCNLSFRPGRGPLVQGRGADQVYPRGQGAGARVQPLRGHGALVQQHRHGRARQGLAGKG